MDGIVELLPPPTLEGPEDAEVTLVGWGSTHSVISEAAQLLTEAGISTNHIHFKWLYPMDEDAVNAVLEKRRIQLSLSVTTPVNSPDSCAVKQALRQTVKSANTMANPSCHITLLMASGIPYVVVDRMSMFPTKRLLFNKGG